MFTGIITDMGTIDAVEHRGDLRVRVATAYDMTSVDIGASIACSGACMTVVEKGAGWFAIDVSHESVSRTAPGRWSEGRKLNLERSLRVGDELGGHIVTGHVDGVGTIAAIGEEGDSHRFDIAAPQELARYLAAKGSIAVDGISLTVNSVTDQPDGSTLFGLNIIPHTAAMTTLGEIGRAHV
jgi:riboflavin synthase